MSAQLFECGLVGLDVDHVDANRSITKFFSECVTSLLIARKVRETLSFPKLENYEESIKGQHGKSFSLLIMCS